MKEKNMENYNGLHPKYEPNTTIIKSLADSEYQAVTFYGSFFKIFPFYFGCRKEVFLFKYLRLKPVK